MDITTPYVFFTLSFHEKYLFMLKNDLRDLSTDILKLKKKEGLLELYSKQLMSYKAFLASVRDIGRPEKQSSLCISVGTKPITH